MTDNAERPHRTPIEVRFSELDPYRHVNHAVYFTYFEVGRTDSLASCGVPFEAMVERGIQLVVTRLEAQFKRPAEVGQQLVVETEISKMRRASSTWHQRIIRTEDGGSGDDELVTAEVTVAVTDRSGRPIKPPDWLFPALAALQEDPDVS